MPITPSEDLRDWIIDNFKNAATDDVSIIGNKFANENGWDPIEVDFMMEEIVEKIQDGILNVIKTYEGEVE